MALKVHRSPPTLQTLDLRLENSCKVSAIMHWVMILVDVNVKKMVLRKTSCNQNTGNYS